MGLYHTFGSILLIHCAPNDIAISHNNKSSIFLSFSNTIEKYILTPFSTDFFIDDNISY